MNGAAAILLTYLGIMNLTGFLLMGLDKRKAIRNAWRIPEARLFLTALAGGSLGVLMGMYFFHHKTRHPRFVWGIPAILILQAALLFAVYTRRIPCLQCTLRP